MKATLLLKTEKCVFKLTSCIGRELNALDS